jgi:hypothetical protein
LSTGKITKLALIAAATAVATMAVPATARADDSNAQFFQSPSGNIHCFVGMGKDNAYAVCTIQHSTYAAPPGQCESAVGLIWPQFELIQGDSPQNLSCVVGERNPPTWPTLDYGQTRSLDSIGCDSEPPGVTCTDSSTGHFFRVSRESYQLG